MDMKQFEEAVRTFRGLVSDLDQMKRKDEAIRAVCASQGIDAIEHDYNGGFDPKTTLNMVRELADRLDDDEPLSIITPEMRKQIALEYIQDLVVPAEEADPRRTWDSNSIDLPEPGVHFYDRDGYEWVSIKNGFLTKTRFDMEMASSILPKSEQYNQGAEYAQKWPEICNYGPFTEKLNG